jgi:hypothetical protein
MVISDNSIIILIIRIEFMFHNYILNLTLFYVIFRILRKSGFSVTGQTASRTTPRRTERTEWTS